MKIKIEQREAVHSTGKKIREMVRAVTQWLKVQVNSISDLDKLPVF